VPYLKRWPHTYQNSTLTNWRAARDNAANQVVDVVYYGTSLTEDGGQGVNQIVGGFPAHLGNWMNSRIGKRHGMGFDAPRTLTGDHRWDITNTSGTYQDNVNTGFGQWSIALGPGDIVTTTAVADRIEVLYVKTKTGGGTIEVKIDAATQTTLNTLDASQTGSTLGTFDASNSWVSNPITYGPHVLTLTNTGANVLYVEGAFFYDTNYSTGFRFWNGAHSGYWGAVNQGVPNCYDLVKKRQPALVIWDHMFNERNLGLANSVNSYNASTQDFIDKMTTLSPNSDILLATNWQNSSWTSAMVPHADMVAAVFAKAAQNNLGVIDLAGFIESCGYNGTPTDPFDWVNNDNIHQTFPHGFLQFAKIHYAYLNDIKPPVRPQGY